MRLATSSCNQGLLVRPSRRQRNAASASIPGTVSVAGWSFFTGKGLSECSGVRQYIEAMWNPVPQALSWARQLPGRCQVCGRWPAQPVCAPCLKRLHTPPHRCNCCARPLQTDIPVCGACLLQQPPAAVTQCVTALDYRYPWDGLIARWKFGGETGWSDLWAGLMLADPAAQTLWRQCAFVVPVPMGPRGLARRGYNQAWELVKALQRHQPGPQSLAQGLVRLRETAEQHSLPRAERLRNLHGAMAAHPHAAVALVGTHVLLIDDVRTTGATLEAAAQALLAAGAGQVSALVLARTPEPD